MGRNGKRHPACPRIEIGSVAATASPEEAAAITAAVEQFMRDTAPAPDARPPPVRPWLRAALLEGTRRDSAGPSPWGDTMRWGA